MKTMLKKFGSIILLYGLATLLILFSRVLFYLVFTVCAINLYKKVDNNSKDRVILIILLLIIDTMLCIFTDENSIYNTTILIFNICATSILYLDPIIILTKNNSTIQSKPNTLILLESNDNEYRPSAELLEFIQNMDEIRMVNLVILTEMYISDKELYEQELDRLYQLSGDNMERANLVALYHEAITQRNELAEYSKKLQHNKN